MNAMRFDVARPARRVRGFGPTGARETRTQWVRRRAARGGALVALRMICLLVRTGAVPNDVRAAVPDTSIQQLTVGALTAWLDGPDLTHVRVGGVEVVRRILVSVRDVNWDTLEPQLQSCSVAAAPDRARVDLGGRHAEGEIDFRWRLSIEAEESGRVVYELEGEAFTEFVYNRVGLCVLHPVETCAGAEFRSSAKSGGAASGVLPVEIAPQVVIDGIAEPMFPACDALTLTPAGGGEIEFAFAGDLFEMEDQRNWTDDSFKTYCTPASLGGPHIARRGQSFHQRVEVRVSGIGTRAREPIGPITVSLGAPSSARVPEIGLAMGSELYVPGDEEAAALRRLGLAHVRADLKVEPLDPEALDASLEDAIRTCELLDTALELALHLEADDHAALERLGHALRGRSGLRIVRVLVFHRDSRSETPTETTLPALIDLVRRHLGDLASVGGGTNMDFAELNRRRPDPAAAPIVAWSTNAQVHASDDASVMETVRGQAATVATARGIYPDHKLAVGPITLRPRFNPAATGPPVARDPDAPPAHVDVRQPTQFAAAWTAASIAALATAGADSLTYFELVGMAGVMANGHSLFPCYHVFAALVPLHGQQVIEVAVSSPDELAALATADQLLIANLTPAAQAVRVGDGDAEPVEIEPYGVRLLRRAASSRAWTA
jgi:D-apionolactonase